MSKQIKFYINETKFKKDEKSPTHQASYKAGEKWVNFLSAWENQYGLSVSLDLGKLKSYMEANPDKISEYEYEEKPATPKAENTTSEVINPDDLPF